MTLSNDCGAINRLAMLCHNIAKSKGFWDKPRIDEECIASMYFELAGVLKQLRKKKPNKEKIATNLAGCIIHILDYAHEKDLAIGGSLYTKIELNKTLKNKEIT